MAERLDCQVVMLVRHPAGIVSSLARIGTGWSDNLPDIAAQPELIDRYLKAFADRICQAARQPFDPIAHGALLWNLIHTGIAHQLARNPNSSSSGMRISPPTRSPDSATSTSASGFPSAATPKPPSARAALQGPATAPTPGAESVSAAPPTNPCTAPATPGHGATASPPATSPTYSTRQKPSPNTSTPPTNSTPATTLGNVDETEIDPGRASWGEHAADLRQPATTPRQVSIQRKRLFVRLADVVGRRGKHQCDRVVLDLGESVDTVADQDLPGCVPLIDLAIRTAIAPESRNRR